MSETPMNPYIEDGISRLRTKWPQSHSVSSKYGHHLVIVPSVILPKGWDKNICTVLFIAPPGFPASCPDHFFTDIDIMLDTNTYPFQPHNTVCWNPMCEDETKGGNFPSNLWPQWSRSMWWSWHLQMWNPNQSSLYTYMQVILQRLKYVR